MKKEPVFSVVRLLVGLTCFVLTPASCQAGPGVGADPCLSAADEPEASQEAA